MFRQLKNYLLYDASPENSEFLTSPSNYLRKLLLDDDNRRHHNQLRYLSNASLAYSTPSPSPKDSLVFSLDMVDDGHPGGLGNPKILPKILQCLPTPDLLICRLVSLRWNVVATSILQKNLDYTKVPPSKLKAFNKVMQSAVCNPICSYAIRINSIREKHLQTFLRLFSLQIINLRVRLNIYEIFEFAKHLQNMTNLRSLHVIVFEDGVHSNVHFIWNSSYENINVCDEYGAWKMGLYTFPNIKNLTLEAEPTLEINPVYDRVIANIIAACGNIKTLQLIAWNSPLGKVFTKFDLCKYPGTFNGINKNARAEEIVNLFFTTNLRFHHLRIEVSPQVRFDLVGDVIHRCGDSLHELVILNENHFERFVLSSMLRCLVKLRLNLWRGPVDFTLFSKQFPALKAVSFNLSNLFEVEQMQCAKLARKIESCKTVKTLTLTRLETGMDAGLIEKLAVMFPNVRELFIEIRNGKALEKIYQVYPELTLLCIELNQNYLSAEEETAGQQQQELTNESFTGIPESEMKVIEERDCGCPLLEFSEESRSCWNIGCLKNLTTLLLRVPNTVNNIALMEGISRLENLQNLVLLPFYSEDEEPVKWCLCSIADNFPTLKRLVTSTEVYYSDEEKYYLNKKIPTITHKLQK